jgi:hypothetical protein
LKYIATIRNVREVCLVGRADLGFWTDRLAPGGASPANIDDRAELWLSAVQLKWLGIAFQELYIAIRLPPDDDGRPRIFLVSAFSTSRGLAWCERTFFQTPYEQANINVNASQPWSFDLRHSDQVTLSAKSQNTPATTTTDETWVGKILLPSSSTGGRPKLFHAKLSGLTEVAHFDPATARLALRPSIHQPVVKLLADSGFSPAEWRVRTNAVHARSKTYAV